MAPRDTQKLAVGYPPFLSHLFFRRYILAKLRLPGPYPAKAGYTASGPLNPHGSDWEIRNSNDNDKKSFCWTGSMGEMALYVKGKVPTAFQAALSSSLSFESIS